MLNRLTAKVIADIFNTTENIVNNWKFGKTKVPQRVTDDLLKLENFIDKIRSKYYENI